MLSILFQRVLQIRCRYMTLIRRIIRDKNGSLHLFKSIHKYQKPYITLSIHCITPESGIEWFQKLLIDFSSLVYNMSINCYESGPFPIGTCDFMRQKSPTEVTKEHNSNTHNVTQYFAIIIESIGTRHTFNHKVYKITESHTGSSIDCLNDQNWMLNGSAGSQQLHSHYHIGTLLNSQCRITGIKAEWHAFFSRKYKANNGNKSVYWAIKL